MKFLRLILQKEKLSIANIMNINPRKITTIEEEKVISHQANPPYPKSIPTMAKLHELDLEFLPYPVYSPDLTNRLFTVRKPQIWLQ